MTTDRSSRTRSGPRHVSVLCHGAHHARSTPDDLPNEELGRAFTTLCLSDVSLVEFLMQQSSTGSADLQAGCDKLRSRVRSALLSTC